MRRLHSIFPISFRFFRCHPKIPSKRNSIQISELFWEYVVGNSTLSLSPWQDRLLLSQPLLYRPTTTIINNNSNLLCLHLSHHYLLFKHNQYIKMAVVMHRHLRAHLLTTGKITLSSKVIIWCQNPVASMRHPSKSIVRVNSDVDTAVVYFLRLRLVFLFAPYSAVPSLSDLRSMHTLMVFWGKSSQSYCL